MTKRQDLNNHDAYHRGRSPSRRSKLPPIPERAGRSPVRRRLPVAIDAAEDRDDRSTATRSTLADSPSEKTMKILLSETCIPSRTTCLSILPPVHVGESGSTVEPGATPSFNTVSKDTNKHDLINENGDHVSITTQPESLVDAITPSMSNISRKHISTVIGSSCDDTRSISSNQTETMVKHYAPEPTWMDFQQVSTEPPELRSIPTDEIIDSFIESEMGDKFTECDDNSRGGMTESKSRETRDQYQLERLQARINQRREMDTKISYKDRGAPNYKTLRSSRIKSVRNLYNLNPSTIHQAYSSHASVANTRSTAPSLKHGHKISPSTASSSGSALRSSLCDTELSEYRGKAFEEMLQLLMNNPSLNKDGQLADVSNLDAIAQSFAALEMSNILHDFELNNSLIEKSCTEVSWAKIPDAISDDIEKECRSEPTEEHISSIEENVPPPEKIAFDHNGTLITSKLSDVTSQTCHDGFELDEIIPTTRRQPRLESTAASFQRNSFTKSPSPVAAAAASVAASMISASGGNKKYGDALPSVLEFPDQHDLNGSDDQDITQESGNFHVIKPPRNVEYLTSALLKQNVNNENEDKVALNARANHVAEEVNFHDEILSTVANDAEELMEVLSILSKYEEAEVRSKKAEKVVPVLPFDELGPTKKVSFIEPLQQDPICGCVVQ